MYSDNTRKLMHWLFSCYANHCNGKEPESKTTEYELIKAKQYLKKQYVKACGYKPDKKCLENYLILLADKTDTETFEILSKAFVKTLQDFAIQNDNFSVANALLTQKKANRLVTFLFDYLFDNDIPLRKEIIELLEEQEKERIIYKMLYKKKCCICGKEVTFPHHHKSVGFVGGYKKDKGELPIAPLCPYHHSELHSAIDKNKWIKEHSTYGFITCNEEQVKELKKIYKGLFMADKETIE